MGEYDATPIPIHSHVPKDAAPHEKKSSEILKYPFSTFPQNMPWETVGVLKNPHFAHEELRVSAKKIPPDLQGKLGSLGPEV